MNIDFNNNKVEKQCKELREAKKCFSDKIAKKLFKLINFIEAAENLESVINNPVYRFHDLKGKKDGSYAMDIDGKKSSYRLIVTFENTSKEQIFANSISIEAIEIEEVSKHYE